MSYPHRHEPTIIQRYINDMRHREASRTTNLFTMTKEEVEIIEESYGAPISPCVRVLLESFWGEKTSQRTSSLLQVLPSQPSPETSPNTSS